MKRKILVTGGAGFIGSHLSRALISSGFDVRIFDNFSEQVHSAKVLASDVRGEVELFEADIRDRYSLKTALEGVDCIVHLAAETGTGQSMYEIEHYFDVNVRGTALLLDILQSEPSSHSLKSIIVASSRAIYGEGAYYCTDHGVVYPNAREAGRLAKGLFDPTCPFCCSDVLMHPTSEDSPFKPMSIYGLTKQVQEQSVLMFARTNNINAFALRYQNVYGPGQSLKNPYTGILAVFSNLSRIGEPINIFEDGLESRDFVYIDDVVRATEACILQETPFVGSINVGSGCSTTVMEVASQINSYFGNKSELRINGSYRLGDIRHNVADIKYCRDILGVEASTTFEQGLISFLDWAVANEPGDSIAYHKSMKELVAKGLLK